MNSSRSSHVRENLGHQYKKCSTFSSWLPHILQIPFENVISLILVLLLIHPWNNFQLKCWHFLHSATLIKFTWNYFPANNDCKFSDLIWPILFGLERLRIFQQNTHRYTLIIALCITNYEYATTTNEIISLIDNIDGPWTLDFYTIL